MFAAARALPNYPRRPGLAAGAVLTTGLLLDSIDAGAGPEVTGLGILASAGCTGWWWLRHVIRPQGTLGHLKRQGDRLQRSGGVASWSDIQESASPVWLRRRAAILRPSLAGRQNVAPTEVGFLLATLGTGRLPGQQVWTSVEDVSLRIGGPGTGKSGSLICHGLDAPGALVTTSTKLDLAEAVHAARCGRAVHLMNIGDLGGVPSTVRWRVLDGCEEFSTAVRRAHDLLPGETRDEGLDWAEKARESLALLLHAAAIDGRRARDITPWMNADASDKARPGQKLAAEQVTTILASVEDGGAERADRWRQHLAEPEKTRGSVIATMRPALAWLGDNTARQVGDAEPGTTTFDVRTLVLNSETLHIVGKDGGSALAPLIAAIVAEITHQALHLAAEMPAGRLDPPLTVLLDEAALVCPVPLPEWTAHFRSRNISLHISVQSIASLRARWGDNGASQILGNVGALLVFGGGKDEKDLKALSTLTGEHRQKILDADGVKDLEHHEHRWVPVLTPAEISALAEFQVLVLRRGIHAVIGWAPMAWDRKGWAPMPLVPPHTPESVETPSSAPREALARWTKKLAPAVDEEVRP